MASLVSTQYEQVTVNSVSYSPELLVNLSFSGRWGSRSRKMKACSRHDIANLRKLADRQDSLFPFSYVQFYVTSLTSSRDILVSKAVARGDVYLPGVEDNAGFNTLFAQLKNLLLFDLHSITRKPPSGF